MNTLLEFRPRELARAPEVLPRRTARNSDDYLNEAFGSMAGGSPGEAMALLRRAAAADWRRPEPWYWMGTLHERASDLPRAAQAYYMALDLGRCEPARSALRRLGHLAGRG